MSENRGSNNPIKENEHTIVPISFCYSGLPRGIPTQHSSFIVYYCLAYMKRIDFIKGVIFR